MNHPTSRWGGPQTLVEGAGRAFESDVEPLDVRPPRLHRCAPLADLMGVMRRTSRCGRTGPQRHLASESGFALVEVMVSAVLVVAFALATLSVIEKSGAAT